MTKLRPALRGLLNSQAYQTSPVSSRDLGNLPRSSTVGIEVLIKFLLLGLQRLPSADLGT